MLLSASSMKTLPSRKLQEEAMLIGQSQAEQMEQITVLRSGLLQQRLRLHPLRGKRDAPGFN